MISHSSGGALRLGTKNRWAARFKHGPTGRDRVRDFNSPSYRLRRNIMPAPESVPPLISIISQPAEVDGMAGVSSLAGRFSRFAVSSVEAVAVVVCDVVSVET
jgi:hypothetical protein